MILCGLFHRSVLPNEFRVTFSVALFLLLEIENCSIGGKYIDRYVESLEYI